MRRVKREAGGKPAQQPLLCGREERAGAIERRFEKAARRRADFPALPSQETCRARRGSTSRAKGKAGDRKRGTRAVRPSGLNAFPQTEGRSVVFMQDMRHGGNVWDEARPGDWLDYSANLRPEGTPEWVLETMRRAIVDTRYYPDRQMRAARAGLAAALGVEEARVLPTAGGGAGDRSGAVFETGARARAAAHLRRIRGAGAGARTGSRRKRKRATGRHAGAV